MLPKISKITELKENISTATTFEEIDSGSLHYLNSNEKKYLKNKLADETEAVIYKHPQVLFFGKIKKAKKRLTKTRKQPEKQAAKLYNVLKADKINTVQLIKFQPAGIDVPISGRICSFPAIHFRNTKRRKKILCRRKFLFSMTKQLKKQIDELLNLITGCFLCPQFGK